MHGAERIHRRTIRLPLAIFLDDADAERIEGLFPIERTTALRGLRDRRLSEADRLLGLVDHAFIRRQRLEQTLPDLVADHHHRRACAGGGIGAAGDRRGRQIAVADVNRDVLKGDAEFFGRSLADHGIGAVADLMSGDLDPDAPVTLQPHARRGRRHLRRIAGGGAAIADQPVAVGHRFRRRLALRPAEGFAPSS